MKKKQLYIYDLTNVINSIEKKKEKKRAKVGIVFNGLEW